MATLSALVPMATNTMNTVSTVVSKLTESNEKKEAKQKEYNQILLVIMENHMDNSVYIQWGNSVDKGFGFTAAIPVPPKAAIGRKFRVKDSNLSSDRPVVRVCQEENGEGLNMVSLLWYPGDRHQTKVFIITETKITEQRDPEVRNWVIGYSDMYQDG